MTTNGRGLVYCKVGRAGNQVQSPEYPGALPLCAVPTDDLHWQRLPVRIARGLLVVERDDARKLFALEQFQAGPAAGGDVRHAIGQSRLLDSCC